MQPFAHPRFTAPVTCSHCYRAIWHPRWAPIDQSFYQAFCWACHDRRQQEFTADQALDQAGAIVAFAHAVISGRVVCDGGAL